MNSRFEILNPCSRKWTELEGEGPRRFCDRCQTPVHAIEEYSAEEWNRIWRESSGHVCGYLSPPPVVERRSRRAIVLGALLTMASPLMAQSGRVRIRVVDAAGDLIPNAEVSLLGEDDKPVRTNKSDDHGEVSWADLPMGNNRFRVGRPGFQNLLLTLVVQDGSEIQQDAVLQVGSMGEIVTITPRKRKHWFVFW